MRKLLFIFCLVLVSVLSLYASSSRAPWLDRYGWYYEGPQYIYYTFKGVGRNYGEASNDAYSKMKEVSSRGNVLDTFEKRDRNDYEVYILVQFPKTAEHRISRFREYAKTARHNIGYGFRSMIFPGYGQYHNQRYRKAFFYFAGTAVTGYLAYSAHNDADDKIDEKNKLLLDYELTMDLSERAALRREINTITNDINSFEKKRDNYLIGMGVLYTINVIDALLFSERIRRYEIAERDITENLNYIVTVNNIKFNYKF